MYVLLIALFPQTSPESTGSVVPWLLILVTLRSFIPLPSEMLGTETLSKFPHNNRINKKRRSILTTERLMLGLTGDPKRSSGLRGRILGAQ